MREYNKDEILIVNKALADKTRLDIIEFLSVKEKCACELLDSFNITQPTLSHHMKLLVNSGLVIGRKDGKWMHYSLNKDSFDSYLNFYRKWI